MKPYYYIMGTHRDTGEVEDLHGEPSKCEAEFELDAYQQDINYKGVKIVRLPDSSMATLIEFLNKANQ